MTTEFTKELTVRLKDCDAAGRMKLSCIMDEMQEIASDHMDVLSVGRGDLKKENMAWIIARIHIVAKRIPRVDERIVMETYMKAADGIYCPRYTRFTDEKGERILTAATFWLIFGTDRKRVLPPRYLGDLTGKVSGLPAEPECTQRMRLTAPLSPAGEHTVRWTDLDLNGHMHNTKYADLVCDLFSGDVMRSAQIADFDISYMREAKEGMTLSMERGSAGESYEIAARNGAERMFEARIAFRQA